MQEVIFSLRQRLAGQGQDLVKKWVRGDRQKFGQGGSLFQSKIGIKKYIPKEIQSNNLNIRLNRI